jgi:hypothetical protein
MLFTFDNEVSMLKFFQSGWAFTILAVLCLAAGLLIPNATFFIILGAVWLVAAIIVRARFSGKKPPSSS